MKSNLYINKSLETIDFLRTADLSSLEDRGIIGHGSGFEMRALGSITLRGAQELWMGVKIPDSKHDAALRLTKEITLTDLISQRAPEIAAKFPFFAGLLAVERTTNVVAILTEDASKDHSVRVHARPASAATRKSLEIGFADEEEFNVIDYEMLARSTAFDVAGEEKLLDLDPPPISMLSVPYDHRLFVDYMDIRDEVLDRQEELTLVISSDSELAQSLLFN
jgi:hypothetical protein